MSKLHTFAVCAYGQSPYLRECLDSLREQSYQDSDVYISTSTPSEWLSGIAAEYGLVFILMRGSRELEKTGISPFQKRALLM